MPTLRSGVLDSAENLFPCLWLGVIHDTWPPAQAWYQHVFQTPGIFNLRHQYAGLRCFQVDLTGIFLPLALCQNSAIRTGLDQLAVAYYGDPFKSHLDPSPEERAAIGQALQAIGPFTPTSASRRSQTDEAFFPFLLSDKIYAWVREHFLMAEDVQLLDSTYVMVTEIQTATVMPWKTVEEFANIFEHPEKTPEMLLGGAFLYENSD